MKEVMFEDCQPEERLQLLKDNAYASEDTQVKRFHTPAERDAFREAATNKMIDCQDIEEQIKNLVEPLKAKLKEEKAILKTHLGAIRRGYDSEETTLFLFDDQEEGIMISYDAEGRFVSSRKLHPTERQTKILTLNQTGTKS